MTPRQTHPLAAILTLLGAIVGAGFATGREIWEFFGAHGQRWPWGVLLSSCIFMVGISGLMLASARSGARHYGDLLVSIWSRRWGSLVNATAAITLFSGLVVALAGTMEIVSHMTGFQGREALLIAGLAMALLTSGGRWGLLATQSLLVPVLLVLFLALIRATGGGQTGPSVHQLPEAGGAWWLSAILYASLNALLASAVIPTLVNTTMRTRCIFGIAAGSSMVLGVITWLLTHRVVSLVPRAHEVALPLEIVAISAGPTWQALYAAALLLALATTGTACSFGLASRYAGDQMEEALLSWAVVLASLPWAYLGLIRVVGTLYVLVGWLGLLTLIRLSLRYLGR